MNKKSLLKSIIGTVVIYLFLTAFIVIAPQIVDILSYYGVYLCVFVACSIAAGLLFKGKLYAAVWSAASVIYVSAVCEWDFEFILTLGVLCGLLPLLIPFFITKMIVLSINEDKELSMQTQTTEAQGEQPQKAFKTALDDLMEKQSEDVF